MKGIQKRLGSLLMAAVMLLSLAVTPAMAAEEKEPPTAVKCEYTSSLTNTLTLTMNDSAWLAAVATKRATLTINELTYTYRDDFGMFCSDPYWHVKGNNIEFVVTTPSSFFPAVFTLSADGYKNVKITVSKTGNWPNESVSATVEIVDGSGSTEQPDTPENGTIDLSKVSFAKSFDGNDWQVTFGEDGYAEKITAVTVNGKPWNATSFLAYGGQYKISDGKLVIAHTSFSATNPAIKSGDVVTITATGYNDLTFKFVLDDNGNASAEAVGGSGSEPEPPTPPEKSTINVSDVNFESSSSRLDWYVTFGTESDKSDNYINAIKGVSVNGHPWESRNTTPSTGGKYCKYNKSNYMTGTKTLVLAFAQKNYSSDSGTDVLKSGDIITITAEGYNDLMFKLVIDKKGNAKVSSDTTPGDIYQLHVKIEGSFEAAIVGQKKYDGVSSATTGGASGNKNSSVTVHGALVKQGTKPTDKDWEKLDYWSEIKLKGSSVSIVPDTEKGTPESADSGMEGVYMKTSSDLTLDGTPRDEGSYLISISITDDQGRTATSNSLPFRIYTGEETLADQIQIKNLKQYDNGLYAWDIMEPWAIKNFGSNVDGEENSVCVPKDLEVWYGSHKSGTYGVLGNDIAWDDVKAGNIPQTLYIPEGCNLTLMNMKVLSSVRIVVENGGKLTLRDSTVQGIIDVQSGGTFSMNYDAFNKKFTTGASIFGQLRLADGAILENAAIYSHTNFLANCNFNDRSNDDAVVLTTGNVTVKGQVFISGDDAGGTEKGQTALKVKGGTLTLGDGAVLAAYGGDGKTLLYPNGGSAIELDNGTISGNGKVIALGGSVLFGSGSSAVSGTGTITTTEAYIQGATAYNRAGKNAQPGKSHDASVAINSGKKYVAAGTLVDGTKAPLAGLNWKSSIDATPDLNKYEIPANSGYVLMNIPYAEFYAAEKDANGTAAQVDAVSSATKQKTRSTLAAGSYHENADGTDISGVIYPVYVPDLSALRDYKQVKDSDTLTITVTLKGKEITTPYTGKDTLFENPDHAYYVLAEAPTYYKTLTVEADGSFSFGKTTAVMTKLDGTSVILKTGSRHTYYKLKVTKGLPEDIASMVSAVTLHTKEDNKTYGLRHVAEIWRGTELGFEDTGVYAGLQGKTIDTITYYLNNGKIQTIAANIKVPKSTKNVTATVENALNTAREAVVTVKNLPADFVAEYTVTSGSTVLSAYDFTVANGKLAWTGTPAFGAYTLTITDKSGAYAPFRPPLS